MTKSDQFLLQKRLAVIDIIFSAAQIIANNLKIAYPKKRIFSKINRKPKKRIEKIRARNNVLLTPFISAAQINMIIAQPIPKFKPGAVTQPGIDIVNENEIEIIQTNNGPIPAFSNKQTTESKWNCSDS